MAWEGYWEYGGNEIINVARTEAYAATGKATWFRPLFENDSLAYMLGDKEYVTPLQDDAPWTDPDIEDSYDFYGVYPLGVEGVENSSRTSAVIESLGNGGIAGRLRHGTKQVVFSCVLIAGSEAGAEHGMKWLRQTLLAGPCGPSESSACFGETLCYLSSEPYIDKPSSLSALGASVAAVLEGGPGPSLDAGTAGDDAFDYEFDGGDPTTVNPMAVRGDYPFTGVSIANYPDPEECLARHLRSMRRVVINNGPTITSKRTMQDGGAAWQVQFTAIAGSPYEFGAERRVVNGLLDPDIAVPWADGYIPPDGFIDTIGQPVIEPDCTPPVVRPIVDPLHPAIIPPPGPPSIPLGNFTPPTTWWRRAFSIPKEYVPLWGDVVPKLQVHARDADLRNLRLRFYADPYKIGDISDDPCGYCGDIIVSYVPVDHTLIFDASEERVYVTSTGGGEQRADSLVFKSDGTPFDWPTLTCGFGYVVALDLPKEQTPPVVDLSLFPRVT